MNLLAITLPVFLQSAGNISFHIQKSHFTSQLKTMSRRIVGCTNQEQNRPLNSKTSFMPFSELFRRNTVYVVRLYDVLTLFVGL